MIKIRKSVFETNSSSTHAIVIEGQPSKKDLTYVNFGEYWWENDTLSSVDEKANYLYTYFLNYDVEYLNLFKETLQDYVWHDIDFQEPKLQNDYKNSWYIDHWGEYVFPKKKETILDIVFWDGYIITGNDNDYSDGESVYERIQWLSYFYKGN